MGTCKIIVNAEKLHRDFPIVTRICGVDNANLDHIRSQSNCVIELREPDPGTGRALVEPMFLWISAHSPESGRAVVDMVKDLLSSVYEEHKQWCSQHSLASPINLMPIVLENPDL